MIVSDDDDSDLAPTKRNTPASKRARTSSESGAAAAKVNTGSQGGSQKAKTAKEAAGGVGAKRGVEVAGGQSGLRWRLCRMQRRLAVMMAWVLLRAVSPRRRASCLAAR